MMMIDRVHQTAGKRSPGASLPGEVKNAVAPEAMLLRRHARAATPALARRSAADPSPGVGGKGGELGGDDHEVCAIRCTAPLLGASLEETVAAIDPALSLLPRASLPMLPVLSKLRRALQRLDPAGCAQLVVFPILFWCCAVLKTRSDYQELARSLYVGGYRSLSHFILLSLCALQNDHRELAGQLHGRFDCSEMEESNPIRGLLEGAIDWVHYARTARPRRLMVAMPKPFFRCLTPVLGLLLQAPKETIRDHLSVLESVHVHPVSSTHDAADVITYCFNGFIITQSVSTGKIFTSVALPQASYKGCKFSDNGSKVILVLEVHQARSNAYSCIVCDVVDVATGVSLLRRGLLTVACSLEAVCFSPDATKIAYFPGAEVFNPFVAGFEYLRVIDLERSGEEASGGVDLFLWQSMAGIMDAIFALIGQDSQQHVTLLLKIVWPQSSVIVAMGFLDHDVTVFPPTVVRVNAQSLRVSNRMNFNPMFNGVHCVLFSPDGEEFIFDTRRGFLLYSFAQPAGVRLPLIAQGTVRRWWKDGRLQIGSKLWASPKSTAPMQGIQRETVALVGNRALVVRTVGARDLIRIVFKPFAEQHLATHLHPVILPPDGTTLVNSSLLIRREAHAVVKTYQFIFQHLGTGKEIAHFYPEEFHRSANHKLSRTTDSVFVSPQGRVSGRRLFLATRSRSFPVESIADSALPEPVEFRHRVACLLDDGGGLYWGRVDDGVRLHVVNGQGAETEAIGPVFTSRDLFTTISYPYFFAQGATHWALYRTSLPPTVLAQGLVSQGQDLLPVLVPGCASVLQFSPSMEPRTLINQAPAGWGHAEFEVDGMFWRSNRMAMELLNAFPGLPHVAFRVLEYLGATRCSVLACQGADDLSWVRIGPLHDSVGMTIESKWALKDAAVQGCAWNAWGELCVLAQKKRVWSFA